MLYKLEKVSIIDFTNAGEKIMRNNFMLNKKFLAERKYLLGFFIYCSGSPARDKTIPIVS
jgi:hypothetical protein